MFWSPFCRGSPGIMWARGIRMRWALAALVVAVGVLAINSNMDANVAGFVLGVIGFGAGFVFRHHAFRAAALSIAAFILLAPVIFHFALMLMPTDLPPSWEQRVLIWRSALAHIAAHPLFGSGFGTLRETFLSEDLGGAGIKALHAHNTPLHIWFELGLVGAVLAAGALGALALQSAKALRNEPVAAAAATGAIAALAPFAFVSWSILAGMVDRDRVSRRRRRDRRTAHRRRVANLALQNSGHLRAKQYADVAELQERAVLDVPFDLGEARKVSVEIFGFVLHEAATFARRLAGEDMNPVRVRRRIGAIRTEKLPIRRDEPRFLRKLALSALKRRFARLQHAARQLAHNHARRMTILIDQTYPLLCVEADDVHPFRIADHVIRRDAHAVGAHAIVSPHVNPPVLENRPARFHPPDLVFVPMHRVIPTSSSQKSRLQHSQSLKSGAP